MAHAVPVAFAFDGDFFAVLADFVKVRKGAYRSLPSSHICGVITSIVSNAYAASRHSFDNKWTTEKALKKLNATGVLEQFIRCVTVPQPRDDPALFDMLDEFQACSRFLSKNAQRGQPCGDVIFAILMGQDGSTAERTEVIDKLNTMLNFAAFNRLQQKHESETKHCQNV